MKVEIVSADHQNKPDVGSHIARQWFDVGQGRRDRRRAELRRWRSRSTRSRRRRTRCSSISGAASSDLTGKACSPNTVHWTYDTWALANGTGSAIVKTGGNTLVLPHRRLRLRPRARARHRGGGAEERRQGARQGAPSAQHARTSPRSCCRRRRSKAKIIGLANAGGDTINSIKQAAEFGIVKGGQNLAGLLVFLTDVHALGLETAQGLIFTETFYWDLNDQTRAFAKRFAERNKRHPSDHGPGRRLPACCTT